MHRMHSLVSRATLFDERVKETAGQLFDVSASGLSMAEPPSAPNILKSYP